MVQLYKKKNDIPSCNYYRGIKLPSHTIKAWERMVETKMRRSVYLRASIRIHAGVVKL